MRMYRFAAQEEAGSWAWRAHGKSKGGFRTERSAACDLAKAMSLKTNNLKKGHQNDIKLKSSFEGVSWHGAKRGWIFRTDDEGSSKSCLTEGEAARVGKKRKRSEASEADPHSTASPFAHVWYKGSRWRTWSYRVKVQGKTVSKSGFLTANDAAKDVASLFGG